MEVEIQQGKQLGGCTGKGFMPGVSGNPNGRPPGKTLKEFAREYLMSLSDKEKMEYLATLPQEIVWKMAEGNPHTTSDHTTNGKDLPTPILPYVSNHNGNAEGSSDVKED